MHPLGRPRGAVKVHNAAVLRRAHRQAGLLPHLAQGAGQRVLARLKLAADPDPFVVVYIVFLFDAVQHQIGTVLFKITQGRLQKFHG